MWRWCTGSSAAHLSVAEAGDGELVVRQGGVQLVQMVQARRQVVQHRAAPLQLVGRERLPWLLQHADAVGAPPLSQLFLAEAPPALASQPLLAFLVPSPPSAAALSSPWQCPAARSPAARIPPPARSTGLLPALS